MELTKELLLIVGRICAIFPLLLATALYMGRRTLAELPVFDFLIIISLGSIVGADIADPETPQIHTAVAVVFTGILQRFVSYLMIRMRWFGRLVTFEPVIVVRNGTLLPKNLRRLRYSVDTILQMLRQHQIFDISSVDIAILEANGRLSVHKKADAIAVTRADLKLKVTSSGVAYPIIIEGRLDTRTIDKLMLSREAVLALLQRHGLRLEDVFFAAINDQMELTITEYDKKQWIPPINH